ncbi:uncharacterized protein LOC124460592 [Drosophila willistoni]|uniref:uncharacterized protein LOC124460592 n=1 Tax=Drosophila willistoni TaxID=7260 RepID=UPI001F072635|nr:uncharacterized protein LOC124460592 [Drosophila willistoni]
MNGFNNNIEDNCKDDLGLLVSKHFTPLHSSPVQSSPVQSKPIEWSRVEMQSSLSNDDELCEFYALVASWASKKDKSNKREYCLLPTASLAATLKSRWRRMERTELGVDRLAVICQ